MSGDRAAGLAARLRAVQDRITGACRGAGRDPAEVTLVVVTKYFPATDVVHLARLGVRQVAENRHQEAVAKRTQVADLLGAQPDLAWHFTGRLQRNKAAAVGRWADAVQSVDRAALLAPLGRAAQDRGRMLDVLVQVSLDPPDVADRGGVAPSGAVPLAEAAAAVPGLRVRGVMGVAPAGADPAPAFDRLAEVAAAVRAAVPEATWLSAGMSGDLEAAVAAGATHLRVGTAVLGNRPAPP